MTEAQRETPQADPARPDPSEARPVTCTGCGRETGPDSLDDDMRMLRELNQLGMTLTEITVEQARRALDAPPGAATEDRSDLKFQRLSRSIRFGIMLRSQLRDGALEQNRRIEAARIAKAGERRTRLKKHLERIVGQAIERHMDREKERLIESEDEFYDEEVDREKSTDLYEELTERLEDEDIERDLDVISRGEMVVRLCCDLKIEPDLEYWEDASWALEEARNNVPGSPFAKPAAEETGSEVEEPVPKPPNG
jgi:hypothetical protein